MSDSQIKWELLRRRIPVKELDFRPGSVTNKGEGGPRASVLAYVTANYVFELLDDACTPQGWELSEPEYHSPSGEGANHVPFCTCYIAIWVYPGWVRKWGVGYPNTISSGKALDDEWAKSAASDAIKRAAWGWGIGRELRDSPNLWVPYDEQRKRFTNPGEVPKLWLDAFVKLNGPDPHAVKPKPATPAPTPAPAPAQPAQTTPQETQAQPPAESPDTAVKGAVEGDSGAQTPAVSQEAPAPASDAENATKATKIGKLSAAVRLAFTNEHGEVNGEGASIFSKTVLGCEKFGQISPERLEYALKHFSGMKQGQLFSVNTALFNRLFRLEDLDKLGAAATEPKPADPEPETPKADPEAATPPATATTRDVLLTSARELSSALGVYEGAEDERSRKLAEVQVMQRFRTAAKDMGQDLKFGFPMSFEKQTDATLRAYCFWLEECLAKGIDITGKE